MKFGVVLMLYIEVLTIVDKNILLRPTSEAFTCRMLLHVSLHSDIAFSGMFGKQQNQTLLVCEHWDLICILQLFCGLCLSWLRYLWPTWAGQILLLVGFSSLFHGTMEAECNSFFIWVPHVMNQKILPSLSSWFSALHLWLVSTERH